MDKYKVCRTCLNTELLNPIFLNSNDNERYSTALEITTGLKVTIDDGLPQFICTKCVYFINKSLEFRLQCKKNEEKLLDCLTKDIHIETKTHESKNIELELRSDKDCKNNDCKDNDENKYISPATKDNSNIKSCINQENFKIKRILNYETSIKEAKLCKLTDKGSEYVIGISCLNPKKTIINQNNNGANCESLEYFNVDDVDRNSCVTESASNDIDTNNKVKSSNILVQTSNITAITSNILVTTGNNAANFLNTEAKTSEKVDTTNNKDLTSNIIHTTSNLEKSVIVTKNSQVLTSKKEVRKLDMERREFINKEMVICKNKTTVHCEVCNKTMLKNSLKQHIEVKHSGLGPVCEHCGRRFGNKYRLQEHYRSKHGYEKHKCGHCSFESASVLSLKNHERLHANDKPFVCDTCGVKFHAAYLLRQHSYLHSSEYRYECNQCTMKFKSGNNLRSHISNCHSGEKIKCPVCDKKFSSKSYAKRHMKRMHGSED